MHFDRKKRRYVDDSGHVMSEAEVRREVHDYVEAQKEKTQHEALKLVAGTITVAAFWQRMKGNIEKWHSVTGAIAYGGKAQLDAEREARIAAKITSELAYLAGFKADVQAALAEDVAREEALNFVANRAGMYTDAAYATYQNNVTAREFDSGVSMGRRVCPEDDASCEECVEAASTYFSELGEVPEIGTLQCLNNCRCYIEYAEAPLTAELTTQQAEAVQ